MEESGLNNIERELPIHSSVPRHVAIIMDGNGRWAKSHGLPRTIGHERGMEVVKEVTMEAQHLGVKVLTLYAFSTENWKRSVQEVSYLMNLPVKFFNSFVPSLVKNNVQVKVMGDLKELPFLTQQAIKKALKATKKSTGMVLNFAFNYGGRREITEAIRHISRDVVNKKISLDEINEEVVSKYLMTRGLVDPDLLIRTSGEERLSNFLLWQMAYTEIAFVKTLWPDFTAQEFKKTIELYEHRQRRFGGVVT